MSIEGKRTALVLGFLLAAALASSSTFAQRPGGGRPGGGGRSPFGGFGGALDLLQNEAVQKDLELLDDQIADVRDLASNNNIRNRFGQEFARLRELPDDQRREAMTEIFRKIRDDQQKKIDEILLPHQSERLRQIELQLAVRRGGASGGLTGGRMAELLDISEEQQEKLREKAEQVAEKLREEQRKLQEAAREEILSVLTPAQRAKYKELLGDPIDLDRRPTGGRFAGGQDGGRFGGQGGQGGRFGGQGGRGGRQRPERDGN